MYAMYFVMTLSLLVRLPLRLPQRGAGRRHGAAAPAAAVTFDDVAGVDEAKMELAEVVVRSRLNWLISRVLPHTFPFIFCTELLLCITQEPSRTWLRASWRVASVGMSCLMAL